MADGQFKQVKGTNVFMRNVSERLATDIKELIKSDPFIPNLAFPRLRFAGLPGLGYKPSYYQEIAGMLGPGKIEIYETQEHYGFNAKFCSVDRFNYFVLSPNVTKALKGNSKTIVHEATHAVQDWQKWREASEDRELDAHFAEALYLVHAKKTHEANNDSVMNRFIIAAEEYKADNGYLGSSRFKKLREAMRNDVYLHYQFMSKKMDPDLTDEEFSKEFKKRERLDGINV
jgi:hypothetical protein